MRGLTYETVCPPTLISLLESLKGKFCVLCCLPSIPLSSMISGHAIPHHLYTNGSQLYVSFASGDSAAALSSLQSCLTSVQSWMSMNKFNLTPDKAEFPLIGNKRQQSEYLPMFPDELFVVKNNPEKSAWNLGVIFDKMSHSAHTYQQCAVHAFTTSGICGIFAVTLIRTVQITCKCSCF